jgi:hypothetical protein
MLASLDALGTANLRPSVRAAPLQPARIGANRRLAGSEKVSSPVAREICSESVAVLRIIALSVAVSAMAAPGKSLSGGATAQGRRGANIPSGASRTRIIRSVSALMARRGPPQSRVSVCWSSAYD